MVPLLEQTAGEPDVPGSGPGVLHRSLMRAARTLGAAASQPRRPGQTDEPCSPVSAPTMS